MRAKPKQAVIVDSQLGEIPPNSPESFAIARALRDRLGNTTWSRNKALGIAVESGVKSTDNRPVVVSRRRGGE